MGTSFWQGKRVLVAGGAGMVGSHLAEQLLSGGAAVRVADNLDSGRMENLSESRDHIEFLQLDLRSLAACATATADMDVVFDLAAKTVGIGYSCTHHGEMMYDTAMISMNLLEVARQQGVRRYLVTSSSCVYPDGAPLPTPETAGETRTPESANEGYGWAKRLAETHARYLCREHGMHIVIVRPGNIYGPRYNWRQVNAHVIPALTFRVLAGENPLVVWGSGRQTRSFLHARDAARAMQLALEKGVSGEAYNLGGEELTVAQLVTQIASVCEYRGEILFDKSKPEGPPRKALLADKLFEAAGFRPSIPFAAGLRETVAAAREFLTQQGSVAVAVPAR